MEEKNFLSEEALVSLVRDNATTLCGILNDAIRRCPSTESEDTKDDAKDNVIPEVFLTKDANILFGKLRRANLLDKSNMPVGLSMAQKGVLASIIADRLGIANLWAAFGPFWQIKRNTLRKGYYKGVQQRSMSLFIEKVKTAIK